MVTVGVRFMKRSDKIVYAVLLPGVHLTRKQIAEKTDYDPDYLPRVLTRLQLQGHIRAFRLPKIRATFYERIS